MVFKRREKRPMWQAIVHFLYPRGGWGRAFTYVKHRLRRLPDTPDKIARGIWAGVFTTFTPFYGLHFLIAAVIAKSMRGNIIAALLGTFFGNPLTYFPIGVVSLQTGHFLLGSTPNEEVQRSLLGKFVDASADLKHNFFAMFNSDTANWHNLGIFYDEVFKPYLIGGIIPGIIAATICYMLTLPLVRAYQKRRDARLAKKRQEKAKHKADVATR